MFKKIISALLVLSMLSGMLLIGVSAADPLPFTDVAEGKWFYSAVKTVYNEGIMEGKGENTFAPTEQMTRAQLVTILSRLANADVTGMNEKLDFADTKKSAWYADAVGWAFSEGLVSGYNDNTFKPNSPVLRQELAVLLDRFLKAEYITLKDNSMIDSFKDAKAIPTWAAEAIEGMRRTGIIGGDNQGCFNPKSSATRAEIATMITRYLEALKTADDPMFAKLADIYNAAEVSMKGVKLSFSNSVFIASKYFSERLLTSMKLDPAVYTVVTDEGELDALKQAHGEHDFDSFYFANLNISIKNTVTGEQTESVNVRFTIYKVQDNEDIFVDPDDFDSGIDDEIYSRMMDTSLYSTGNIARLAKFFNRAEAGEDLTAAYIGGSITQGAGADSFHCWARITTNWIRLRYPEADVEYVNAGIGGTGSNYGITRFDEHVLSKSPDLIFIEFFVNDGVGSEFLEECFESLVRSALMAEGSPAVVVLMSYPGSGNIFPETSNTYAYMTDIAAHYGVPVVDVSTAVANEIANGTFTDAEYCPDGCHPNEWGYSIMSDMIINMYETVIEMAKTATADELEIKPVSDETITPARFTGVRFLDSTELEADSLGSWTAGCEDSNGFVNGWTLAKGSGNDPLTFTVDCKNLIIFRHTEDEYTNAAFEITVDGEPVTFISHASSTGRIMVLVNSDTSKTHTISIRAIDGDEGKPAVIYGFAMN